MKYKFKKGSEVEVWNKRDVPSGSWCCAEILSGNGHTYSVRYSPYSPNGSAVERVSRKAIRPLHPVNGPRNWMPGDTVEVFDKYSWKAAEVVRVVGNGYYLVRLLGSSLTFRAHMSALRFQLSWQDDKWVMIGKKRSGDLDNRLPQEGNLSHQMLQRFTEVEEHSEDNRFPSGNDDDDDDDGDSKEHYQGFLSGRKKRLYIESCPEVMRKMRAVEGEGRRQQLVAGQTRKLLKKVDAVASPCTILGGKHMHASLNKRRIRIVEEALPILECSDTESTTSSVGSCSTSNNLYRLGDPTIGLSEDLGSDIGPGDTETSPVSSEFLAPKKEDVEAEIHRLELHAYQTTLAALHASGPISWEQETLISDLRRVLNISTDEHLLEIRRLIAVNNTGPLR